MSRIIGVALLLLGFGGSANALATATVTIYGSEMSPGGIPDTGTITISFTNTVTSVTYTETVPYGQYSTAGSVASAFGATFSADPLTAVQASPPRLCTLGVCAKADGASIKFQLAGAGAFGPVTVTNTSTVGSFQPTASSWTSITPAMTFASSHNPAEAGESVTFTATIVGSSGVVPTGTVTFLDGATTLGGGAVALDGSASAGLSLSTLGAGHHNITAEYSGDSHYGVAVAALVQFVHHAGPFIVKLLPNSGVIGESIEIHGAGFGTVHGSVFFGATAATVISSWTDNKIVVRVPAGTASGLVAVIISGATSNGKIFTITASSCPVFP